MFRKLMKICVALGLGLSMVACSASEDETKEVNKVVEEYLTDCKNGDYEKADALLSANADSSLGLTEAYEEIDSELESLNLGDDFDSEARSFVSYFMDKTFKEYKIDKTTLDSSTKATVELTLKGKDSDSFNLSTLESELNDELMDYLTEHEQELEDYLKEHSEDELEKKLYKDLSKLVFDKMKGNIDALPDKETQLEFSLEKENNDWKITNLENVD